MTHRFHLPVAVGLFGVDCTADVTRDTGKIQDILLTKCAMARNKRVSCIQEVPIIKVCSFRTRESFVQRCTER